MNKLAALLSTLVLLAACGKQEPTPASPSAAAPAAEQPAAPAQGDASAPTEQAAADQAASEAPAETVSEVDDEPTTSGQQTASTTQPSLKLGGPASGPPTSARFKEGANYQKIVPAQPTNAGPGKVEVAEVFWYGCGHCFTLDPAIESWRSKTKPQYVEFSRIPAMWNETTRMHARVFYTAELLGKLEQLHSLIFREMHVNGNQLNSVDKIADFFQKHGVSKDEFTKAFSSFAVESKLQRADFLNKRYKVQSVPMMVVNGKYSTDVGSAGSESQLFALIDELAAHEHGG
ncbi:thiol:disulfide interchange protein DsbA/DsbL [Steroidobacter sp. S1-65]|uniref:Thiol:disulfide interchange protein DsbA n=1 Tax=Steroidobacter gossypii TaxID=2805490 RepID=A0ABS1WSM3_9GAMM|nr:thiol:disulfide interchange protein DsbA/DsbL [Steroidobacter gossypii]MBM0103943.1 thiol:disulfide interchange protein DsbA/DsbL [Steroidobacter gossypii]